MLQDYDQAIALDPKNAFVFNSRGWQFYQLKQYKQAIVDFRRALVLAPDSKESQAGLAQGLKAQQAQRKTD